MNVRHGLMGLALLGLPSAAVAATPSCAPRIENAWVRAAPPTATMLAGYGVLHNPCKAAVQIRGVSSPPFAMAMVHETAIVGGVSKMRHAKSLAVPANGSLVFEPGGLHFMLMHPKRAIKEGETVQVSVKLADGRQIAGSFVVRRDAPAQAN